MIVLAERTWVYLIVYRPYIFHQVAKIRLQSSANGTTWLTRLGTVGLLTATCTIAVSASKVFYDGGESPLAMVIVYDGDECDDKVAKSTYGYHKKVIKGVQR